MIFLYRLSNIGTIILLNKTIMNIEFRSIRKQLDELFNLNEDHYRIDIINDKNDNWTGQWILTKNIAKDDVSYIPQMVEGTLSNSLKELVENINKELGSIKDIEDIKYFKSDAKDETLKNIIDSSEYLKEHSPNSTAAYIRKTYAINCNTMISYGINENETYTTAVKIFKEIHPEIPLLDL